MIRKVFLVWGCAVLFSVCCYGQDYALNVSRSNSIEPISEHVSEAKANRPKAEFQFNVYGEIPVAETAFREEHYLGDAISTKWNTFLKNYTHEYSVEVGLVESGVEVLKPAIFKAVERANKYVKKALKKGLIPREDAVRMMGHVLDCANVICFEDGTEKLEQQAAEAKQGEDVLALFDKIELVRM